MAELSKSMVNLLIIAMIISGAANTIVYSLQNRSHVEDKDNEIVPFNHPFMQAITMFIGEGLCFLLYIYVQRTEEFKAALIEAQAEGKHTKVNYFWLMVPAGADLCTSTLQYIALNYISPSIYQMLRGGVIVVTAIFSVVFLKKKLTKAHLFGCVTVVFGITIVGMTNFIFPLKSGSSASSTAQAVAMMLILLSLITNGILFVSEEKLFEVYYMHPFQVVGAEGMWGLAIYIAIMPLLTFIKCPNGLSGSCVELLGDYYFERPDVYFYEITHNGTLLFLVFMGVFTIAVFNICGVSVTKYVSSLARSIVDVTRTVIVWGVGLVVSFTSTNQWENTKWQAICLEFVGFVVLVFGNLVYNGIIKLPFLEKNKEVSDLQVSMKENSTTD